MLKLSRRHQNLLPAYIGSWCNQVEIHRGYWVSKLRTIGNETSGVINVCHLTDEDQHDWCWNEKGRHLSTDYFTKSPTTGKDDFPTQDTLVLLLKHDDFSQDW